MGREATTSRHEGRITTGVTDDGRMAAGSSTESLASLTKGHACQLLLQSPPLLRVGRFSEFARQRKETLFLGLLGLQTTLNQLHQDTIGACLLSLRQRTHALAAAARAKNT